MEKLLTLSKYLYIFIALAYWINVHAAIQKSHLYASHVHELVYEGLNSNSLFNNTVSKKNKKSDDNNKNHEFVKKMHEKIFPIIISNKEVLIKVYDNMKFKIYALSDKSSKQTILAHGSLLSVFDLKNSFRSYKFKINEASLKINSGSSVYGNCKVISFDALSHDSILLQSISFIIPTSLSNVIIFKAKVKNESLKPVDISYYKSFNTMLDAKQFGADSSYKFWSFQGGSYPERYDWIFPLTPNYFRENYQGMNAPDYGGGIPVVDLWTKEQGLAFASIDIKPQLISLPIKVENSDSVSFAVKDSNQFIIQPGKFISEVPCAVITHHGDYFNALRSYSKIMQLEGFSFPDAPKDAYQPEWCAWGYERNFNKEQILKSLNKVKKLGFRWVTIDDGWQNADGDWEPSKEKFPGGEKDFIAFVDSIHSHGLKVRLWWVPFAAQDSSYNIKHYSDRMNEYGMKTQSKVALEHPDWFLLDKNGNRVQVSWWNSYLLCPALPQVRSYYEAFVKKAITKWGIDGFKIDGQNLNEVQPCYNPEHHHKNPEASTQGVPGFFRDIYKTAIALNPNFLIQACPCGTNFSFYNLPYVNQTVASDPIELLAGKIKR